MRSVRSLLILVGLLALAVPAAAFASSKDVIRDCADDGVIDGDYSDRELRQAEDDLPSDLDEYTDCREAIRAELGSGSGGGRKKGAAPTDGSLVTKDGAVASSRDDIDALGELERSRENDAPSIKVGGRKVTVGDAAGGKLLGVANTSNDLPASLLTALILLGLMVAGGGVLLARRRGLTLADIRRVPLPRIFRR